jgi:hypothetical protein
MYGRRGIRRAPEPPSATLSRNDESGGRIMGKDKDVKKEGKKKPAKTLKEKKEAKRLKKVGKA